MAEAAELRSLLTHLWSDTITERKKAISTLRVWLSDSQRLSEITKNSHDETIAKREPHKDNLKTPKSVTWRFILRCCIKGTEKELESLKESCHKKSSATTINKRQGTLNEACSFLRFCVRKADRNPSNLQCFSCVKILQKHILSTLCQAFSIGPASFEYSSLFIENILNVEEYAIQITVENWTTAVYFFSKVLLKSGRNHFDITLAAKVFQKLIFCCPEDLLDHSGNFLDFFIQYFQSQGRIGHHTTFILKSLVTVVSELSIDKKEDLMRFHLSINNYLCTIWNSRSYELKPLIAQYYRFMFSINSSINLQEKLIQGATFFFGELTAELNNNLSSIFNVRQDNSVLEHNQYICYSMASDLVFHYSQSFHSSIFTNYRKCKRKIKAGTSIDLVGFENDGFKTESSDEEREPSKAFHSGKRRKIIVSDDDDDDYISSTQSSNNKDTTREKEKRQSRYAVFAQDFFDAIVRKSQLPWFVLLWITIEKYPQFQPFDDMLSVLNRRLLSEAVDSKSIIWLIRCLSSLGKTFKFDSRLEEGQRKSWDSVFCFCVERLCKELLRRQHNHANDAKIRTLKEIFWLLNLCILKKLISHSALRSVQYCIGEDLINKSNPVLNLQLVTYFARFLVLYVQSVQLNEINGTEFEKDLEQAFPLRVKIINWLLSYLGDPSCDAKLSWCIACCLIGIVQKFQSQSLSHGDPVDDNFFFKNGISEATDSQGTEESTLMKICTKSSLPDLNQNEQEDIPIDPEKNYRFYILGAGFAIPQLRGYIMAEILKRIIRTGNFTLDFWHLNFVINFLTLYIHFLESRLEDEECQKLLDTADSLFSTFMENEGNFLKDSSSVLRSLKLLHGIVTIPFCCGYAMCSPSLSVRGCSEMEFVYVAVFKKFTKRCKTVVEKIVKVLIKTSSNLSVAKESLPFGKLSSVDKIEEDDDDDDFDIDMGKGSSFQSCNSNYTPSPGTSGQQTNSEISVSLVRIMASIRKICRNNDIENRISEVLTKTLQNEMEKPLIFHSRLLLLRNIFMTMLEGPHANHHLINVKAAVQLLLKKNSSVRAHMMSLDTIGKIFRMLALQLDDIEKIEELELYYILEDFADLFSKNKMRIPVRIQFCKCLCIALRSDKSCSVESRQQILGVLNCFFEDPHRDLRNLIGQNVDIFFHFKENKTESEEEFIRIRDSHLKMLISSESANPAEMIFSVFTTLGHMAVKIPSLETNSFFNLCILAQKHSKYDYFAKTLIARVVYTLGYENVKVYTHHQASYFFDNWCNSQDLLLEHLPFLLLGYSSMREIISENLPHLVPRVVINKDLKKLELVAQILQKEIKEVLIEVFPQIITLCLPYKVLHKTNRFDKQDDGVEGDPINEFLSVHLDATQINQLYSKHLEVFYCELLWKVSDPVDCNDLSEYKCSEENLDKQRSIPYLKFAFSKDTVISSPVYSFEVVLMTLQHVKDLANDSSPDPLMKMNDKRYQSILHQFAERFQKSRRAFEKRQLLSSFSLLLKLIGTQLLKEFEFREALHVILREIKSITKRNSVSCTTDSHSRLSESTSSQLSPPNSPGPFSSLLALSDSTVSEFEGFLGKCDNNEGLETALNAALLTLWHMLALPKVELWSNFREPILATLIPCLSFHISCQYFVCEILNIIYSPGNFSSQDLYLDIAMLKPFSSNTQITEIIDSIHCPEMKVDSAIKLLISDDDNVLRLRQTCLKEILGVIQSSNIILTSSHDSSTVNALVVALIQQCNSSFNLKGRLASVKCLGTIGAINIESLSFVRNEKCLTEFSSKHLLDKLIAYLLDEDYDLVRASRITLINLTTLSSIKAVIKDSYSAMEKKLINPYIPKSSRRVTLKKSEQFRDWVKCHWGCNGVKFQHPEIDDPFFFKMIYEKEDFCRWITLLCCSVIYHMVEDSVIEQLYFVCTASVEFCQEILPVLIHASISADNSDVVRNKNMVSFLFKKILLAEYISISPYHKKMGRLFLNVLYYLRNQELTVSSTKRQTRHQGHPWDRNFWIPLDLFEVAAASWECGAYFNSLFFLEICCEVDNIDRDGLHSMGQKDELLNKIRALLQKVYMRINEPDSLAGARFTCETSSTLKYSIHEHDWSKAMNTYDLLLHESFNEMAGGTDRLHLCRGLLYTMQNIGCNHIMENYLQGLISTNPTWSEPLMEYQYAVSWRNGNWNLKSLKGTSLSSSLFEGNSSKIANQHQDQNSNSKYHRLTHSCLLAIREQNKQSFNLNVEELLLSLLGNVNNLNLEGAKFISPLLSKIQSTIEMVEGWNMVSNSKRKEMDSEASNVTDKQDDSIIKIWANRSTAMQSSSWECVEPVFALRKTILEILFEKSKSPRHQKFLFDHLGEYITAARHAKHFHLAHRVIIDLQSWHEKLASYGWEETWKLQKKRAKIFWDEGNKENAMLALTSILKAPQFEKNSTSEGCGKILLLYGKWNAALSSSNPSIIITQLKQSLHIATQLNCRYIYKAQQTLAQYADRQYEASKARLNSATWEAAEYLRKKTREEYSRSKKLHTESSVKAKADAGTPGKAKKSAATKDLNDLRRHVINLKKQVAADVEESSRAKARRDTFLQLSIENHLLCLQTDNKNDISIFRLISIWFETCDENIVNRQLEHKIETIPTFKFIPLMYQLVARISKTKQSDFQTILHSLITLICKDHPFHTIYMIQSLTMSLDPDKKTAAGSILNDICHSERHSLIFQKIKSLSSAYMQLANLALEKDTPRKTPIDIPIKYKILKLQNVESVAVPTAHLPIDPSAKYNDVPGVHSFDKTFFVVGGLTLPKIINCFGTDGKTYCQLVKGKDDLRQDAVMQQVFNVFNTMLKACKETKKRDLSIRTYIVLPLNQDCGILEFAKDTLPLGEYLVKDGVTSAHRRYSPNGWHSTDCRDRMRKAKTDGELLQSFRLILENFPPVFRHFFYERYTHATDWFSKRLAYTRSVAAWSMIGYVLGLGDRHIQNILIDEKTAELVHIDFGIAFDQGKLLPTPELVPFRLTRDIIDGMGILGVDGVFRRCCEETLSVLRTNMASLYTILEVFIHDPLHKWTISPKALKKQRDEQQHVDDEGSHPSKSNEKIATSDLPLKTTVNAKQGERVLYRLKEKLSGVEDGVTLSVEGHVNHLIQEAQNEEHLSRIFHGWSAWV